MSSHQYSYLYIYNCSSITKCTRPLYEYSFAWHNILVDLVLCFSSKLQPESLLRQVFRASLCFLCSCLALFFLYLFLLGFCARYHCVVAGGPPQTAHTTKMVASELCRREGCMDASLLSYSVRPPPRRRETQL